MAFLSGRTSLTTVQTGDIADNAVTGGKLNPSLVAGDVIYASGTDTITRLAKGSDTTVLTLASGLPSWASPPEAGLVLIETITTTGATWDFETGINSTYESYFCSYRVVPATDNAQLTLVVGTGGTPTYQTSLYAYCALHNDTTSPASTGADGASDIRLHSDRGMGNVATEGGAGNFWIHEPSSAAASTFFSGNGGVCDTAGNFYGTTFGAAYEAATAVTAIRLLYSSGNITGEASIWGLARA